MASCFMNDEDAMSILSSIKKDSDVNGANYFCVFLPAGHGAKWGFDSTLIDNIVGDYGLQMLSLVQCVMAQLACCMQNGRTGSLSPKACE